MAKEMKTMSVCFELNSDREEINQVANKNFEELYIEKKNKLSDQFKSLVGNVESISTVIIFSLFSEGMPRYYEMLYLPNMLENYEKDFVIADFENWMKEDVQPMYERLLERTK